LAAVAGCFFGAVFFTVVLTGIRSPFVCYLPINIKYNKKNACVANKMIWVKFFTGSGRRDIY